MNKDFCTVKQLQEQIDFYVKNGQVDENSYVLITLDEPSVGSRASVGISWVSAGIDWEHGQLRITPQVGLCRKGNNLSDTKPKQVYQKSYFCPNCTNTVGKNDNYCKSCGQRLGKVEEE